MGGGGRVLVFGCVLELLVFCFVVLFLGGGGGGLSQRSMAMSAPVKLGQRIVHMVCRIGTAFTICRLAVLLCLPFDGKGGERPSPETQDVETPWHFATQAAVLATVVHVTRCVLIERQQDPKTTWTIPWRGEDICKSLPRPCWPEPS